MMHMLTLCCAALLLLASKDASAQLGNSRYIVDSDHRCAIFDSIEVRCFGVSEPLENAQDFITSELQLSNEGVLDNARRGDDDVGGPGTMGNNLVSQKYNVQQKYRNERPFLVSSGLAYTCMALWNPEDAVRQDKLACFGATGTGAIVDTFEQSTIGENDSIMFSIKDLWVNGVTNSDSMEVKLIRIGYEHACILYSRAGGDDWFNCWGFNKNGRLGSDYFWDDPERFPNPDASYPGWIVPTKNTQQAKYLIPLEKEIKDKYPNMVPKDIHLGEQHTCILFQDKTDSRKRAVACFGSNLHGQIGLDISTVRQLGGIRGQSNNDLNPDATLIEELDFLPFTQENTPKAICTGGHYTCVAFDNNQLTCFGIGEFGNLGYRTETGVDYFVDPLTPANPRFVDLGLEQNEIITSLGCSELNTHTCVVVNNRKVKCFGHNQQGQLGQGSKVNRYATASSSQLMGKTLPFVKFGSNGGDVFDEDIKKITIRDRGTTCVLSKGTLKTVCWGPNQKGEAGVGTLVDIGTTSSQMGSALVPVDWGEGDSCYSKDEVLASQCPCGTRRDYRITNECVPVANSLEAARLARAAAKCLIDPNNYFFASSEQFKYLKLVAHTLSCAMDAHSRADPQGADDEAATISLGVVGDIGLHLLKQSTEGPVQLQGAFKTLAETANTYRIRQEPMGTVAARASQGTYGFVPPFRPTVYLESDKFIRSLQFLNTRRDKLDTMINTIQTTNQAITGFKTAFESLFDGLGENAGFDKAIADQEVNILEETLKELWLRGEGNANNLKRVATNSLAKLNIVVDKKNDLADALQKLEEAKAAADFFNALVESVTVIVALSVAAPFTGGASLAALGTYAAANLPDLIEVGQSIVELGSTALNWVDTVREGELAQPLASINEGGGSVDIVAAAGSMEKLFGFISSVAHDLKVHSEAIRSSFGPESSWPKPSNVQITSSPSVWAAINLETLNALVSVQVCPSELLVGRRLRAQAELRMGNTSLQRNDLGSNMRLRAHANNDPSEFRRSLNDKIEEAEEDVKQARTVLTDACVVFLNTFKQVSVYGRAYHSDVIEAGGVLKRHRAAVFRSKTRANQEEAWGNRRDELTKSLAQTQGTLNQQLSVLEAELEVSKSAEELEYSVVMNTLRDLCAAIEYMVPDSKSKTCIDSFVNGNIGAQQNKFSKAISTYNSLELDFRSQAIKEARSGRRKQTVKIDITNLVNIETFKASGNATFLLSPTNINQPELYCARNAEVVHVGVVPVGTATGPNNGLRSQIVLSGPYIKRIPGDTFENPVDVSFTASIPDLRYNYDYKFQTECDDGDRVTLCGTRFCQSVATDDSSDVFIARPALFSTFQISLLGTFKPEKIASMHSIYLVAEVLLTYEENCKDVDEVTSCTWGQSGSLVGVVTGAIAGVVISGIIVFVVWKKRENLPSIAKPSLPSLKTSGSITVATPWKKQNSKPFESHASAMTVPDHDFYATDGGPRSFSNAGYGSAQSFKRSGNNDTQGRFLVSPGSWQAQPEFQQPPPGLGSPKTSWNPRSRNQHHDGPGYTYPSF